MKIEDYSKYYIQGSDHYLIPKDVFKELFGEMLNLKDESKKQKEVIDNLKKYLKLNIELIKEQPLNDELTDNFILARFNSLLNLLKEVSE